MSGTGFSPHIYAQIREGAQRSARAAVPVILDALGEIAPRTVIDVGCGEGWWGHEFESHGFTAQGLDMGDQGAAVPVITTDLEKQLPEVDGFGLAVCLEVAEHLTPARGDTFIGELCALANTIVFSAAIPGQGGTNHLNEQWPAYWVQRFEACGFTCSGALRWGLWADDRVEWWYRQNLIVAARYPEAHPALFDTPLAPVWPVVHPHLHVRS